MSLLKAFLFLLKLHVPQYVDYLISYRLILDSNLNTKKWTCRMSYYRLNKSYAKPSEYLNKNVNYGTAGFRMK